MPTPAAPRSTLRRGLIALALCGLLGAAAARADELQDASALLKTGQHPQALERVNKALAAKPRDPQARFLEGVIFTEQGKQDLAAWTAHKRQVNAAKRWIKVGLSRVAMFRYPRERDFVVVSFDQDYRSDGLSKVMRKRQYWVKEDARWKIIYEGAG